MPGASLRSVERRAGMDRKTVRRYAWRPPIGAGAGRLHPHVDHRPGSRPQPFIWRKTADEISESLTAYGQRISDTGH